MKKRTKLVMGSLLMVTVAGTAVAVSTAGGKEDPAARTVEAVRGEVVDKALAVGRIEPLVEVAVKSQLAGVVRRQFADLGDFVRAGEPLLEIRPNPTPLELVEARRQLELRELEVDDLKLRRDRLAALVENAYVSREEFEAIDRQHSEAALQLQMARERLALLEEGRVGTGTDRVETVIKAPIDGFILEKDVEIGDPVVPLTTFQEGTVLMRMAAMDRLLFRGTVDEIDVGRLEEGMPATIKIGALPETELQGTVSKISLKGRERENATVFPVEITVTAVEGTLLRAGYSANADVVIQRRKDVVVIPERLVSMAGDTARVTVFRGDGQTEERTIRVGLSDGITVEVVEGLGEGERVVEPPPREIR